MATKAKKKGATQTATVRFRFANEGRMAKKKGHSKRSHRRKNPSHPKRRHHRRRRNPETFMGALGHLIGAGLVGLGAGVGVTYLQSKVSPGSAISLYGFPALGLLAGAAILKKAPMIGVGVGVGSVVGPFTIPVATKVLGGSSSSSQTAAALSAVQLGAVQIGEGDELYDDYDVSGVSRQYAYG